ncbi:MAG: hypothetical protein HYS13_10935 [Planctomycetia bacterium]|nr:hypothetical protein [Planctomycetia bacterium]
MNAGFLTDAWRDGLTVIGLIGSMASLAGLAYAIVQIRRTKKAAEAVRETLTETRQAYWRFVVATAVKLIAETRTFVEGKNWDNAAIRFGDLADIALQMAAIGRPSNTAEGWVRLADQLRDWNTHCREVAVGARRRFNAKKWREFQTELDRRFHAWHGPFPEQPKVMGDDSAGDAS